jgi:hypothetical protein
MGKALAATLGVLIASLSLAAATPATARAWPSAGTCGAASYINVSGHCVRRPVRSTSVPYGATARCRDGSYSFSEHHRGTCSWHGGVATWLRG